MRSPRRGHLGGLYPFQADELESATEIAARIPAARFGRAIEVRPLVEHESVVEQVFRQVWEPSTRARSDNSKQALSLRALHLRFG